MSPIIELVVKQERLEGDFRWVWLLINHCAVQDMTQAGTVLVHWLDVITASCK